MRPRWFIGVLVLGVVGCGSQKLAPVSGQIMLNGKPLANASINFVPLASNEKTIYTGPSSWGKTDAEGNFSLKTVDPEASVAGAMVGKHRVTITARHPLAPPPTTAEAEDSSKYNFVTVQEYEVPAGGTKEATFELVVH